MTMDKSRAYAITGTCVEHKMQSMGIELDHVPESLENYSLQELLDANHTVADDNNTTSTDRPRSIHMHCDDRLIAALYVLYHYDAQVGFSLEPIVSVNNKAVLCVAMNSLEEDGEG